MKLSFSFVFGIIYLDHVASILGLNQFTLFNLQFLFMSVKGLGNYVPAHKVFINSDIDLGL